MIPKFIKKEKIPHKPGVYIFKNSVGRVIYVGKAIDLTSRVSSYFTSNNLPKQQLLVSEISDLDTIIVESELEALILEANLIKKYLPKYNVRLTDDKDYLYIKITKENFPRVLTARKQDLKGALKSFGPFPSSTTVKKTLKTLRRVFPWCSNPPKFLTKLNEKGFLDSYTRSGTIAKTRLKPCFYYHLGLCPGPCKGIISEKDYRKIINRFIKLMEGKKQELISELVLEMSESSEKLDFEKASSDKKTIEGIEYLTQPNRIENYLENPNYQEDLNQKGLIELKEILNLPEIPIRIEGYDISNTQGKDATGSLVVLTNGEIDKSQYRKFKIKLTGKPNDFAMHSEMMGRRLNHLEWSYPQMFLIDGGKGQISAVQKILNEREVKIPIFGLAKRMEWIYDTEGNVIKLKRTSLALKLIQKLRDESHRFALKYHRLLRSKAFFAA